MSNANIGYGTRYSIETGVGTGVFIELAEVINSTPPEDSIEQVKVTHYQSPGRTHEYIPGLIEGGSASVEMNFDPHSATDQRIEELKASGTVLKHRMTYPNGVTVTFPASIESYSKAIPIDDRMTSTVSVKVSGAVVIAAGSAPVNSVIPAIAGTVADGQTLTAWPGVWSQAATFGYVWKANGSAISGATDSTYTLVTGDVGAAITVEVTATNSAGSAMAASAATVAVAS